MISEILPLPVYAVYPVMCTTTLNNKISLIQIDIYAHIVFSFCFVIHTEKCITRTLHNSDKYLVNL